MNKKHIAGEGLELPQAVGGLRRYEHKIAVVKTTSVHVHTTKHRHSGLGIGVGLERLAKGADLCRIGLRGGALRYRLQGPSIRQGLGP
jgi:hypothetical protein